MRPQILPTDISGLFCTNIPARKGRTQTGPATSESSETEALPPAVAGPHFRRLKPGATVAANPLGETATAVLWDN